MIHLEESSGESRRGRFGILWSYTRLVVDSGDCLFSKCGAIWGVFSDNNNNNDIDVCCIEVENEVGLLELMSGGNK